MAQVFAIGLDLEATAFAALDHLARTRVGAEQAIQVRPRAHGGAVFFHEMACLATELREGFLAQRDQILQLFLVGIAARNLRHGQLFEVGRLVTRVAQGEGAGLAHEEERRAASVLVVPEGAIAGALETHATTKVGAIAHVERERGLDFIEARVESRRAEAQLEGLPVTIANELEAIPALHKQGGASTGGCAEFEAGDAVGERGAGDQRGLAGLHFRGQRAVDEGPVRVVAKCASRRNEVLRVGKMETCERGNGQNRH